MTLQLVRVALWQWIWFSQWQCTGFVCDSSVGSKCAQSVYQHPFGELNNFSFFSQKCPISCLYLVHMFTYLTGCSGSLPQWTGDVGQFFSSLALNVSIMVIVYVIEELRCKRAYVQFHQFGNSVGLIFINILCKPKNNEKTLIKISSTYICLHFSQIGKIAHKPWALQL